MWQRCICEGIFRMISGLWVLLSRGEISMNQWKPKRMNWNFFYMDSLFVRVSFCTSLSFVLIQIVTKLQTGQCAFQVLMTSHC